MAFLYGKSAIPVTLSELATLSAADGKDVLTVPFDGYIEAVHMKLGGIGGTSGNTDVTVYYTKPTSGLSATGDLWTVASGVGRIAYDASNTYLEWTRDNLALYFVERGGSLSLNVDVIPGTASTDLEVTLFIQPLDRE